MMRKRIRSRILSAPMKKRRSRKRRKILNQSQRED